MSETETNKTKNTKKHSVWLRLIVFLSLLFVLLSMIGLFGGVLKGFFLGVFGFGGYAVFSILLVIFLLKIFGVFRGKVKGRSIFFIVFLSLLFLVYLQIITSHAEYSRLEDRTLSSYMRACYAVGTGTSGGWILALPTYPLLLLAKKFSAIIIAVLFFVVLFIALFPMMRGTSASASASAAPSSAPVPSSGSVEHRGGPSLFVDKVRPGQKDAQRIRMKGIFARKGPEPQFFDATDDRPLNASEGVVPEPQPARFDLYGSRDGVTEDDSYEEYPYVARRTETCSVAVDEGTSDMRDMPAFVRRMAGDGARASRTLYGDDTLSALPEQPHFDTRSGATETTTEPVVTPDTATTTTAPTEPTIPTSTYVRPRPHVDGIIENLFDLERLRENERSRTPAPRPMLGEEQTTVSGSSEPLVRSEEPAAVSITTDPNETTVRTEPTPDPAPQPAVTPVTIRPSEASHLDPAQETPTVSPRVSIDPTPIEESVDPAGEVETPTRVSPRKPRSDIGGTHRSSVSGYVEPRRVTQMDIDHIEPEPEPQPEPEPPARPYTPPPVSLLTEYPPIADDENVEERGALLVQALASFHIKSEIVDHRTGPTFTQFAVTLPDNMSVSKLTSIEMDINRKLKVSRKIRIIPSVPGLDAVGIEVPNDKTSMVGLRSIISSPIFEKEGKLCFAIGVDVSGKAVYGDILKMPHLLVAGSTGSGKSVALNVMITSIMYHYSPEYVRFIMVDPKMVELTKYAEMPHMLIPNPIIEPDKAVNALTWAVAEMDRRYRLLKENKCVNLGEYNALMKRQGKKGLYYIVFIIDEMAELMTAAKREVEEKVGRLTAKARAAGIHLVIATQRPSVDVITGVIKNNIPSRIAFKVTSFTDSKTILDRGGAESLFGYGDMLYEPPEGGDPIRLQGPYINEEIESIVAFVKENNDARYDNDVERLILADKEQQVDTSSSTTEEEEDGEDPLFSSALLYFINNGQASISKLQIKYRIGYGRAARIVETMSERGYLGPAEGGNKSRQVIITLDEYYQLYGEYPDGAEE